MFFLQRRMYFRTSEHHQRRMWQDRSRPLSNDLDRQHDITIMRYNVLHDSSPGPFSRFSLLPLSFLSQDKQLQRLVKKEVQISVTCVDSGIAAGFGLKMIIAAEKR